MAYVVRRPRGRWEVRESFSTPEGPRSRTLVSFTALSDDVVARAQRASRAGLEPEQIVRAARKVGAPVDPEHPDELAAALLRSIARGRHPRPALLRLVRDRTKHAPALRRPIDDALDPWIGASLEERGDALIDLLGLVDALPAPRRSPLAFPGLSRARLADG
ncbi:MAG: hypothetical protein WDA27_03105 [Actinomycetota bacterium]